MADKKLSAVPEVDKISFSGEEEKICQFWKDIDAFGNCLKQSKDKPKFTFYDGPPFATGLPHYGHILAGTIKDVVTRWAHQTGHHVERRFGWDTHGLPVEYEIDKAHNIKGPEDVQKMGIKKYNDLCRGIVTRYADEWETIITRLGRWIDFKNDYKTMYPWFMESVWWVFSQLFEKGLVYRGVKVMPFSTACSTPISNFEAGQNYKETQDPSVVVSFPLEKDPTTFLLAWTTTPWTLPSNLALCVNPDMIYVKLQGKTKELTGVYIMMESRITQVFKKETDFEILSKFKGKELEGTKYVPLFNYFKEMESVGAFKVLLGSYVTSESGTGVVHQAPYFGEDDFRVCLSYGIITKDQDPICPVDDTGRFVSPVEDFIGLHVKEADKEIIKHLKASGRLIQSERINHSYPYCWRSDTPLIYKAVPSWFVRVEHMQQQLLDANSKTYWVPNFVKEKRFGNWLRDARDWAISRNRYWGTPIPLWVSDDLEEVVCIGSIEELERLSGETVTDLHRDNIDHITIPSKRPGKAPLKRISEVFDCWFESGSMPYAQVHYPFEKKKEFEDCFPADFIAEGIDQTRGWFYTLLVLSTSLFGKPPFKNLIVNGLVLASDGQKMSKRKKNYPDPLKVVNAHGADALRLYLMNSPSVRGENLKFKEEDVRSLLKEVFIPWLNAYRFFVQQTYRLEKEDGIVFTFDGTSMGKSTNVMDRWILSFTQSLLAFVHKEMAAYRLYTVTPRLIKFVDNLTNWYVRFNRKRLKGETDKEDCVNALETLFTVLLSMIRVMSPFTPFITETMYQNLKKVLTPTALGQDNIDSVHYLMVPHPMESLICPSIETSVSTLQSVVELGRYVRDKVTIPVKYPLPEIIVIHKDQAILDDVMLLEHYLKEELNVKKITVSTEKERYGVVLKAELNFRALGSRLKKDLKSVQKKVSEFTCADIEAFIANGSVELFGHTIESDEIFTKYKFGETAGTQFSNYEAHSDASVLILLDTTRSQEMLDEGLAREITNRIQKLRKSAKLLPTDEATVWLSVLPEGSNLARVAVEYHSYIEAQTKTAVKLLKELDPSCAVIETAASKVGEATVNLAVTKEASSKSSGTLPTCPWMNVVYNGVPRMGNASRHATLLLENPLGTKLLKTSQDVLVAARGLFGYDVEKVQVYFNSKKTEDVSKLAGKTVVISCNDNVEAHEHAPEPFVRFVNVHASNKKATILTENPTDVRMQRRGFVMALNYIVDVNQVFVDSSKTNSLQLTDKAISELESSQTIYA